MVFFSFYFLFIYGPNIRRTKMNWRSRAQTIANIKHGYHVTHVFYQSGKNNKNISTTSHTHTHTQLNREVGSWIFTLYKINTVRMLLFQALHLFLSLCIDAIFFILHTHILSSVDHIFYYHIHSPFRSILCNTLAFYYYYFNIVIFIRNNFFFFDCCCVR